MKLLIILLQIICIIIISTLSTSSSDLKKDQLDYCNREWPKIELFIPIAIYLNDATGRNNEIFTNFLRSLNLFWNLKLTQTSVRLIYDGEREDSIEFKDMKNKLKEYDNKVPGGISLTPSYPTFPYGRGSDRQQIIMFNADNWTTAEYVAFSDTDCVFLTYVDREDLFEDGKPVINGRTGPEVGLHPSVRAWKFPPEGNYNIIGLIEPLRCMSYFPVIIKTKHIKEMREYMEKFHNGESFNYNFIKWSKGIFYSQFGIMCTYLWNFHRDEYKWYVHSEMPSWDGKHPAGRPKQDTNLTQFTKEMMYPKPRIATHARYRHKQHETLINTDINEMNKLLQKGVCMSPPFPNNHPICTSFPDLNNGYNVDMHRFEFADWTKVNSREILKQAFNERKSRLINCNHIWDKNEMKLLNF